MQFELFNRLSTVYAITWFGIIIRIVGNKFPEVQRVLDIQDPAAFYFVGDYLSLLSKHYVHFQSVAVSEEKHLVALAFTKVRFHRLHDDHVFEKIVHE